MKCIKTSFNFFCTNLIFLNTRMRNKTPIPEFNFIEKGNSNVCIMKGFVQKSF